jgi:hypothetical protein
MKLSAAIVYLTLTLTLTLSIALLAQTATAATSTAKVAELNFLAGHWEGHVDKTKIEQTCSVSDPAVMVCMFQLTGEKGTEMIEFYTIRDTPTGVEERIRFFSTDLKDDSTGGDGVTMKLASSSAKVFVFENPNGTYPKRSTLTRTADDEFHSHIELVDPQGRSSAIDAYWKKTK